MIFFLRKSFAPLLKYYCYPLLQLSLTLFLFLLKYIYNFYILLTSQKASENTSFTTTLKGHDSAKFSEETRARVKKIYPLLLNPKLIHYPLLVVTLHLSTASSPLYYTCAHAYIFRHHFRDDTGIGHLKRFDVNQIFKCILYAVYICDILSYKI